MVAFYSRDFCFHWVWLRAKGDGAFCHADGFYAVEQWIERA
jgi:hypothetical protein